METLQDYRAVWASYPWVAAYAVIVVVVLILAIVGTALGVVPLAVLFIPALAGAYVHHMMVRRRMP